MTEPSEGGPSKRERIILYGVIPVLAAIVGAIATVVVGRYTGSDNPSETMIAIIKDPTLSPNDKAKLMALVNVSTERFYTLLGSVVSIVSLVCGVLVWAVSDWIRRR
jgi:hypothetical protein